MQTSIRQATSLLKGAIEFYKKRQLCAERDAKPPKKDAAFSAQDQKGRKGNALRKDAECHNCHKKGHFKADCWAKGSGKEGQGPRSKKAKPDAKSSNSAHQAEILVVSGWLTSLITLNANNSFGY